LILNYIIKLILIINFFKIIKFLI